MKARLIFHALAILGLTAMVVFAQEPSANLAKNTPQASPQGNGQSADRFNDGEARRHLNGIPGRDRTATQDSNPGQTATRQATDPKVTPHQASAKNSAHATESLSTADSQMGDTPRGGTADKNERPESVNVQFAAATKNQMRPKPDANGSQTAAPKSDNDPKRHHPGNGRTK